MYDDDQEPNVAMSPSQYTDIIFLVDAIDTAEDSASKKGLKNLFLLEAESCKLRLEFEQLVLKSAIAKEKKANLRLV